MLRNTSRLSSAAPDVVSSKRATKSVEEDPVESWTRNSPHSFTEREAPIRIWTRWIHATHNYNVILPSVPWSLTWRLIFITSSQNHVCISYPSHARYIHNTFQLAIFTKLNTAHSSQVHSCLCLKSHQGVRGGAHIVAWAEQAAGLDKQWVAPRRHSWRLESAEHTHFTKAFFTFTMSYGFTVHARMCLHSLRLLRNSQPLNGITCRYLGRISPKSDSKSASADWVPLRHSENNIHS